MPRNKLDWSIQYIIKVWETYSSIMFSEPCWQIIGMATFFTILQLVELLCWTVPEESFESYSCDISIYNIIESCKRWTYTIPICSRGVHN